MKNKINSFQVSRYEQIQNLNTIFHLQEVKWTVNGNCSWLFTESDIEKLQLDKKIYISFNSQLQLHKKPLSFISASEQYGTWYVVFKSFLNLCLFFYTHTGCTQSYNHFTLQTNLVTKRTLFQASDSIFCSMYARNVSNVNSSRNFSKTQNTDIYHSLIMLNLIMFQFNARELQGLKSCRNTTGVLTRFSFWMSHSEITRLQVKR